MADELAVFDTNDPTEAPRRQFPRTDLRGVASATIYPPEGEPGEPIRCSVLTRDLSAGGFGIALSERLRPKQLVELDIDCNRLLGEVRWCREAQFGLYLAGCRIVESY